MVLLQMAGATEELLKVTELLTVVTTTLNVAPAHPPTVGVTEYVTVEEVPEDIPNVPEILEAGVGCEFTPVTVPAGETTGVPQV